MKLQIDQAKDPLFLTQPCDVEVFVDEKLIATMPATSSPFETQLNSQSLPAGDASFDCELGFEVWPGRRCNRADRCSFRWQMKINRFSGLLILAVLMIFIVFCQNSWATNVSGTISSNTTWTLTGSPYIVTGNVLVQGAASPVLTLQPGVQVLFNQNTDIRIGTTSGLPGIIQAVGTAASPIVFSANAGSPTPGYWAECNLRQQHRFYHCLCPNILCRLWNL